MSTKKTHNRVKVPDSFANLPFCTMRRFQLTILGQVINFTFDRKLYFFNETCLNYTKKNYVIHVIYKVLYLHLIQIFIYIRRVNVMRSLYVLTK